MMLIILNSLGSLFALLFFFLLLHLVFCFRYCLFYFFFKVILPPLRNKYIVFNIRNCCGKELTSIIFNLGYLAELST